MENDEERGRWNGWTLIQAYEMRDGDVVSLDSDALEAWMEQRWMDVDWPAILEQAVVLTEAPHDCPGGEEGCGGVHFDAVGGGWHVELQGARDAFALRYVGHPRNVPRQR